MENANLNHGIGEKLPFKVKLSYGLSGYSSFMAWTMFSYYGLYFFTDIVGLSAAFAGAIISLGTLWDAITDPLVGGISDNLKCKYGRRRPLIIGGALPFFLIAVLLFTNWGLDETASKIYFVIVILLYYTAQTVFDISASSLGSEMTMDYDERASLATWKNYFGLLCTVVVGPCLMLVAYFGEWFENSDFGWSCTIALYMLVSLVFIYILWRNTRGYERHREDNGKFELKNFAMIFKNKSTRIAALIFAVGIFSNTINYAVQIYYFSTYVGLNDAQVAAFLSLFGFTSIAGAWVCDRLMIKFGKKLTWIIGVGLEGIVLIIMVGLMIPQGAGMGLIYALAVLLSIGNAAVYQVPWAMIPDCVDVTELATGKRMDGVIFGLVAFLQKAAGALGAALLGTILTVIGYNADLIEQTATATAGIKNVFGFLVGGLYVVSVLIVLAYPLSKKRHADVVSAIEKQKAGGTVDLAEFKDLI